MCVCVFVCGCGCGCGCNRVKKYIKESRQDIDRSTACKKGMQVQEFIVNSSTGEGDPRNSCQIYR